MSHLNPGLISAYNSLTDKHLAGYFSNSRIRRHLQRAGLITRSGRIVPDKEYRHRLSQRQHQRRVRECLAQAIFHKVLEMERAHQIEIKQRLEEFAKRERVHKIKLQRSNRYEEDFVRILSPRPPTGARLTPKQRSAPEGDRSESSESPGSSRPNTAPGKMQRPVRLKPIHSKHTTAPLRRSSPSRPANLSNENDQPLGCTMESRRRLTGLEASRGISPYCLPVINTFVTPVPPPTKRKELKLKVTPSSTHRGRRLRLSTLGAAHEDPPMLRSSVHQSRVSVNMIYFGKKVHLSHDLHDTRDEVKVFQQHCGGENLCVYKGLLHKGETFQFISRRHRGYPFSLTFFLNGLQVERLSSCCEFKHRRASRLGGRHRHFGFCSVEGASPCYKCIIAMGLDKQPTPPPKRGSEDGGGQDIRISSTVPPDARKAVNGEDDAIPATSHLEDVETQVREERAAVEGKARDGYEEDFEADDEGPADDADTQEKMSSSPQSQTKEQNVSETEDDGNDDITSRHSSPSSSPSSEESEAETDIDRPKESDHEETGVPPEERNPADPEETSEVEPKDSEVQNSAEDSTDITVSDSTGPSRAENNPHADTEVERTPHESQQEEDLERAKSVQEKLAEAVLKEPQDSSEPELSDTSTEEEEDEEKRPEQDNKEEPVTGTEQETKRDEGLEVKSTVQDEEEMHGDEMKQKQEENTGDSKDTAEETPAENHPSEEAENTSLRAGSENKMEENSSENREDAAAKHVEQTDEVGREAKSREEDESSASVLNTRAENATVAEDDAEAGGTTETKAELSDEREVLSCEEAPVADAEEGPREDAEDRTAAPRADVTAGNWSNVLEESGGTAGETGGETSGDAPKAGRDDQEEAAEEAAAGRQEEEEEEEEPVQTHDEVEEKPEDKDEEKQTDPNEMGEGDYSEERREEDNEMKTDSNVGGNENEQNHTADGKTDQSQKTNEGEDGKCVKDGNEKEEKEATDKTGEKTNDMCGKVKKNETDESRAEQTEAGERNSGKCEKEEEGGIGSADELGKNADVDSTKDMKKPEGSTVEPKEEAANIEVQETVREASGEEKENREIDAENGEISSRTESVAQKDAEEAETEAQKDVKTAKHTHDEIKTVEVIEEERAEATDLTVESGDGTEKHTGEQMDPTPDAGSAKSDVKDEESNGDGPGAEIKERESCNFPEEEDEILIKEVRTEVTSEQSSAPVPPNSSDHKFDIFMETSAMEDHPLSAVTELTAARGKSGETEASKASEEGTSVVLKPRASSPDKEECPAVHPEVTEIIDAGENVDLVSNWVTTHQVAKFFETFVEPLDDLKETPAEVTQCDQSAGPLSPVKAVDDAGREQTKEEATEVEVELEGSLFKTSERCEKDPSEDKDQVQEETEVVDLMLENEPREKELTKGLPARSEGSRTSLRNDKGQEGFVQNDTEQDRVSTPGMKALSSPSPGHQPEQGGPDLNHKPTPVIEFRAPSETEQHSQCSTHPGEPSKLNGNQPVDAEEIWGASEKVTKAKFTWERTPEEPVESLPVPQNTSASGEKTDLQLIPDLRHSKDRLSVSSLNDTHFARSSYPLLAAARTQNGQ